MLDPAPEQREPPVVQPPAVRPMERVGAGLEALLCSGLPTQIVIVILLATAGIRPKLAGGELSAAFIFSLTLLDTVLLISLIVFFIRAHGESVRDVLLGSRPIGRELLLGLVLIPASLAVVIVVLIIVQRVAPGLRNVPHNPFADLAKTRAQAVLFAFVVMVAGGVREEIQRGFILRRFEQYLGGGSIGLMIFSIVFGLGHLEQGRNVALATGILGALWGAIYLRRRSVAAPMVGHAGFNLLQVAKFLVFGS